MNGQVIWLLAVAISGVSSIMGAVNFVTTIVKMRAPGMGFFLMPLFVCLSRLYLNRLIVIYMPDGWVGYGYGYGLIGRFGGKNRGGSRGTNGTRGCLR